MYLRKVINNTSPEEANKCRPVSLRYVKNRWVNHSSRCRSAVQWADVQLLPKSTAQSPFQVEYKLKQFPATVAPHNNRLSFIWKKQSRYAFAEGQMAYDKRPRISLRQERQFWVRLQGWTTALYAFLHSIWNAPVLFLKMHTWLQFFKRQLIKATVFVITCVVLRLWKVQNCIQWHGCSQQTLLQFK